MPDQPEDPRERQNRLLERLGNALLSLKAAIEILRKENTEAHAAQVGHGQAHLTQMVRLTDALNEARKDIERAERTVDDLRRDITPVHGTPLATREELERPESIELGPVKVPAKTIDGLGRALPFIVAGFVLGLAALIVALWLSGTRLLVADRPPAAPALAPPAATHLVPPLEKPIVP